MAASKGDLNQSLAYKSVCVCGDKVNVGDVYDQSFACGGVGMHVHMNGNV